MSLMSIVKKIGIDLFSYFFKGARVAGALEFAGRSRIPIHEFPRPDSIPLESNGTHIIYSSADLLRQWKIIVKGKLTLKNNSKNHAYNIILLNADELFDSCDKIPKLTSIAPNDRIEINVSFVQYMVGRGGQETDVLRDIPAEKENRYLLIKYENERGTQLITKFALSFANVYNEYTYK